MAIGSREVSFTIDVDSGKLVRVEKGNEVVQTGPDPTLDPPLQACNQQQNEEQAQEERTIGQEIADIRRSRRHLRVAEIIQTTNSPGCVYWDGIRWVRYC
jgi:hypothetical protein